MQYPISLYTLRLYHGPYAPANVYAPTAEWAEIIVQGTGDHWPITYEVNSPSYESIE